MSVTNLNNSSKDSKLENQQSLFSESDLCDSCCESFLDIGYLACIDPVQERADIYLSIYNILASEFYWDSEAQLDNVTDQCYDACMDMIYGKNENG